MQQLEHLEPLDTWFLDVENRVDHQHIAAIATVEGPAPSLEDFQARLRGKFALAPRLRQVIRRVPGGLARPVWIDDEKFDVDFHVRRTAVPAPGGKAELTTLVSRLVSLELDRRRPLWEVWLVEGLADGQWALVLKAHHAMLDGIAGVNVMATVFDLDADAPVLPADDWQPRSAPSDVELVTDAVRDVVGRRVDWRRAITDAVTTPRETLQQLVTVGRGLTDLGRALLPTNDHGLVGHVSPHRVWTWAQAAMDDVKVARKEFGGTLNDVVLAAVTRGYRDLMVWRGEAPGPNETFRTVVPVSIRGDGDEDGKGNRVSVMLVDLPIGQPDPVERLRCLRAATEAHKARRAPEAGAAMLSALSYLPPPLVTMGTRLVAGALHTFVQHNVASVTTNVPGPPVPLYAAGRKVHTLAPYVLVGEGITTGVAVFSYCGTLTFGVTGDLDHSPDVEVLADGIAAGVEELAERAR